MKPIATPFNDRLVSSITQEELTAAYREIVEQRIAANEYKQKLDDLTQFIVHALRLKIGLQACIELTMSIDLELHPEWKDEDEEETPAP